MLSDSVLEASGIMNSPTNNSGQKLLVDAEGVPNQSILDEDSVFIDEMDESMLATNRSASPRSPKRKPRITSQKMRLTNDLGELRLTKVMRDKEKSLRQQMTTLKNRPLKQTEKQQMIQDFLDFVETLINMFRLSEKLDSAGYTLTNIF